MNDSVLLVYLMSWLVKLDFHDFVRKGRKKKGEILFSREDHVNWKNL